MKLRKIHGLEPRSKTALISDWLRFRFHDVSGSTDIIIEGDIGGVDQADARGIVGGTVAPYADRGWITPDGTTGSLVKWSSTQITAALDNFFALDTLDNVGGLLVQFAFKWGTANTVSLEHIFEYGQISNARGGIAIQVNGAAAGNQNVGLLINKVGTTTVTAAKPAISAASAVDVLHTITGYWDCKNHVMYCAVDGDWANATQTSLAGFTGFYPDAIIGSGQDGLAMLSGQNGGAGIENMLNSENAGGDFAVHNLTFIRFEKDMIAEAGVLSKACAQHYASPREIPSILSGY